MHDRDKSPSSKREQSFRTDRPDSRLIIGKCPQCGFSVRMVFPIEAASILDVSLREIFRLIDLGRFHFIETDEKVVMICVRSVANDFRT